uniref:TadE/TadG family type IV pilus assembly protein n=1 Tax=Acetatifactor sp. TaxID=1872090 RepID=UPI004056D89D
MKKYIMSRKVKRCVEGYFTVEAAMVLPMVCVVVLFIVYLWFFQYNRCVMEQDAGVLALRGVAMQTENQEERMMNLRNQANGMNREKYIAWECNEAELKIGNGVVEVVQSGRNLMSFGIAGLGEQEAMLNVSFENHLLNPVSFVRNYRKIMGGE